jgi:acetyltransferase-like isoleucine patch superfamily enzyme
VVGAGAVVTKSFGPNCIVGGVPARLLRTLPAVSDADEPSPDILQG